MEKIADRIHFLDNPYPNGHKIAKFIWSGRIDESETIWFDFHLETDKYYADDESDGDTEEESESDWKAKILWRNYQSCKISSTFWGEENKGIKINTHPEKLNFDNCIQNQLTVDKLPFDEDFDYEDLAFNMYLLGHDSCANHKIIVKKNEDSYEIEWTGKIALTYSGSDSFDYDFTANIQNVKFEGFYYPKSWTLEKAEEVFRRNIADFDYYKFIDLNPKSDKGEYKLIRIDN